MRNHEKPYVKDRITTPWCKKRRLRADHVEEKGYFIPSCRRWATGPSGETARCTTRAGGWARISRFSSRRRSAFRRPRSTGTAPSCVLIFAVRNSTLRYRTAQFLGGSNVVRAEKAMLARPKYKVYINSTRYPPRPPARFPRRFNRRFPGRSSAKVGFASVSQTRVRKISYPLRRFLARFSGRVGFGIASRLSAVESVK